MDIEYWSREQEVPVLGLMKKATKKKLSVFKEVKAQVEPAGFRFAYTTNLGAWERYHIAPDRKHALILFANYYEKNATFRNDGITELIYTDNWIMKKMNTWVLRHGYAPVVDVSAMSQMSTLGKKRAEFIMKFYSFKIFLWHKRMDIPEFFLKIAKSYRRDFWFIVMDIADDEKLLRELELDLWRVQCLLDMETKIAEYSGKFEEESIEDWMEELLDKTIPEAYAKGKEKQAKKSDL